MQGLMGQIIEFPKGGGCAAIGVRLGSRWDKLRAALPETGHSKNRLEYKGVNKTSLNPKPYMLKTASRPKLYRTTPKP